MYEGPLDILSRIGMEGIGKFYSIYPGKVISHEDKMKNNSIMVEIMWPALIFNGRNMLVSATAFNFGGSSGEGIKYLAPEIGDMVLVTFQNGDPNQAMYIRNPWPTGSMPPELTGPHRAGFVTPKGNKIYLDDEESILGIEFNGEVNIKAKSITLDSEYLELGGGVIKLGDRDDSEPSIYITELTNRLNKTIEELNQLKAELQVHTHGSSSGPTTQPASPFTTVFTPFIEQDYSNPNQLM